MEGLGAAIAPWLNSCRWFAGGPVRVERAIAIEGPWRARVLWLIVEAGGTRYNVPVIAEGSVARDATADPEGRRALFALLTGSEPAGAEGLTCSARAAGLPPMADARRIVGEQSNTSIVYRLADSTEVIVKIFRLATPGRNPGVELQQALSATATVPRVHGSARLTWPAAGDSAAAHGATGAPAWPAGGGRATIGSGAAADGVAGEAASGGEAGTRTAGGRTAGGQSASETVSSMAAGDMAAEGGMTGEAAASDMAAGGTNAGGQTVNGATADVAIVQEYVSGAMDAWQLVTAALAAGKTEHLAPITRLGQLTRSIHGHLAERFPASPPDAATRQAIARSWARRAQDAFAVVPELRQWREKVEEVYSRAMDAAWPDLQRIHGDFHLGQVLDAPGRGWLAFDFEGEPLRPLAERSRPDLPQRDVAGMLRSFGYAAGSAKLSGADPAAMDAWERSASSAFLEGYGQAGPAPLLEALVLDKALYEVTYEAAQRPSWIPIPLSGIARILGAGHAPSASVRFPMWTKLNSRTTYGRVST